MLLGRGADYKARNAVGQTAADIGGAEIFTDTQHAATDIGATSTDQNAFFLEAARAGNLESVRQLCSAQNVNCRDIEGRHSTPLHFAAGYNRVQVRVTYFASEHRKNS